MTPSPSPIGDTNDFAPTPTASTDEQPQETEPADPCDLPDPPDWCDPPSFVQPELPTGTGWEDCGDWSCDNDGFGGGGGVGIAPPETSQSPPEQTPIVVTTRTPTVVGIETTVEPSATKDVNGGGTSRAATSGPPEEHTKQQDPPGQPGRPGHPVQPGQPTSVQDPPQTGGTGEGNNIDVGTYRPAPELPTAGSRPETENKNLPAPQQTVSTGNSLLDTIINQIGKAQPGAQPSQAILPTPGVSGEQIKQEPQLRPSGDSAGAGQGGSVQGGGIISVQGEEAVSGTVAPGVTNTAPTQDTIAIGNQITLGSATLSLTPGLSTTVGTGTDTTLIAIQTDSVSYTIITISSSGTAVTATVTNAPATMTLPKTGFEVSTTDSTSRAAATSHTGQSTAATSSKGIADRRRAYIDSWSSGVIGLLALALW